MNLLQPYLVPTRKPFTEQRNIHTVESMKLLHTGDLHLGKSLHETSLLEDQKYVLDQLRSLLAQDDYAALIIAGDIYDRTIPNVEAVELFSNFLISIRSDFPDLYVCIIPGNHDSSQRLSFADQILGNQRVHIVCDPEKSFTPINITAKNGERLSLFLLPFLAPGTLIRREAKKETVHASGMPQELDFLSESTPILMSQADLATEADRRFAEVLQKNEYNSIPSILVAHLFTIGGKQAESERLFLGTAEQISPSLFSCFSYIALGHLHRSQKITSRMYYSGSPLAYAFDEADNQKVFLKVEINCITSGFPVTVTPIPIQPFRKAKRLSGSFTEFYTGDAFDAHSSDYVEITLTDDALIANPMNLLRAKFPYLLSLRQGQSEDMHRPDEHRDQNGKQISSGEKRDPVTDFCNFEEMLYGSVDPDKKALFSALLAECSDET